MNDLKITMIQSDLVWENSSQNLANFDVKLAGIIENPDIIILPEMFNTAFSINPAHCAETMEGESVKWLRQKAEEKDCVIVGSILVNDNGTYYNRMLWMQPDGNYKKYDKRHLFRMSDEYKLIGGGNSRTVVEYKGWKINLLICYDLRFPVWSKNTYKDNQYEFDLMLYVANWPASRSHIWQTLLKARAIENQSYVIGVNRVGIDGFITPHSGDSMLVDPTGIVMLQAAANEEGIYHLQLSKDSLQEFRNKFTVGLDWDDFQIK